MCNHIHLYYLPYLDEPKKEDKNKKRVKKAPKNPQPKENGVFHILFHTVSL